MANTRQPKRPQMDYYEFKRQREERLRARMQAEGREETVPEAPEEEFSQTGEEERRAGIGAKALGALSGFGSKLKGVASRKREEEEDLFDEYDAEPQAPLNQPAEELPSNEEAAEEAETQAEPVETEASAPSEEPSAEETAEVELPADLPEEGATYEDEQPVAPVEGEAEAAEWDGEYETDEPEPETDGNEDNPFSAFMRTAKALGGKTVDLFGKLRDRAGKRGAEPEEEFFDGAETPEEGDFEEDPLEPDSAADGDVFAVAEEAEPSETPATAETGAMDLDLPEEGASQPDTADSQAAQPDLFFDDEPDEDTEREKKGGLMDRVKSLFSRKPRQAEPEDEPAGFDSPDAEGDEGDAERKTVPELNDAGRKKNLSERMQRFLPVDDEDDELNFAAADAPADKEDTQMNEQESKQVASLSELLAKELDDAPVLSRQERKALAAKNQAAGGGTPSGALNNVDEPTMEFTPVRARDTSANMKPVSDDDYDDEDEEEEAPKPARKGLFGRSRKVAQEEYDEDDEDDEDVRPVKRPAVKSRNSRYEDEDDDEEDDEEIRPRGKSASRRSDYDDEDDDYDDDDYEDDDYEDERPSVAKRILRFLRGLLILVIIGALLVLGLRELENRDILSLDSLRGLGGIGPVVETVFPDPDASNDAGQPDLPQDGTANG